MIIFTMGFTQKTAKQFFDKVTGNNVQILIDIRLNNRSQLAGFTKGVDLEYFLDKICGCEYIHENYYAPTDEILSAYKKSKLEWEGYEEKYLDLLETRDIVSNFERRFNSYDRIMFLCSEPTPEHCHRRLLAEYIQRRLGCEVIHI